MISVVIPTRDDEADLPRALSPLVRAAVEGLVREVIVVDAGSRDATLEIADDAGCRILRLEGGRDARLGAGAEQARSDWILLLGPDAWLPEGWEAAARAYIEGAPERPAVFPAAEAGLLGRIGFGGSAPLARLQSRRRHGAALDGARPVRLGARLVRRPAGRR
jgi:glycosyltransferase involved in cell wall biosynthesis